MITLSEIAGHLSVAKKHFCEMFQWKYYETSLSCLRAVGTTAEEMIQTFSLQENSGNSQGEPGPRSVVPDSDCHGYQAICCSMKYKVLCQDTFFFSSTFFSFDSQG